MFSRGSGISRSYPAHVRHQVSFGLVSVCVKGYVDSVGEVRTKHIDACIMRFGYTYEYVALNVQYLLGWTTRDEITSHYLAASRASSGPRVRLGSPHAKPGCCRVFPCAENLDGLNCRFSQSTDNLPLQVCFLHSSGG